MKRYVYVRGLGILGQYGTKNPITGSKTFIKIKNFSDEPITKIGAGYFGNLCGTDTGKVYYWGWQFCPVTGFRQLMIYNEHTFMSRWVNRVFKNQNIISPPQLLFEFNQPLAKIGFGNAYAMALTKSGILYGTGANNSVCIL